MQFFLAEKQDKNHGTSGNNKQLRNPPCFVVQFVKVTDITSPSQHQHYHQDSLVFILSLKKQRAHNFQITIPTINKERIT